MVSAIRIAAILGAIAPVMATDPYANTQYTETIGAQEVGSTTIDGNPVYSMNYCTVVHNTMCQVSLSTGGEVPPTYTDVPGYSAPETYASVPTTYGQPGSGTTEPLTPTATYGGTTTGQPTSADETYNGSPPDSATPTGAGVMATAVAGNVVVALAAALLI